MGLVKRVRAAWPGALRQQITRTGILYFGTVMVVAMATFASGNNLLYLMLAALFSVLFVSGFVSKLVLAGLEVDVAVPQHVSAKRKFRGMLRIKNLKRWMPSFSIQVTGAPDSGFAAAGSGGRSVKDDKTLDAASQAETQNVSLYFPVIPGGGPDGVVLDEPIEMYFSRRGRVQERTFELTTRFPFGFAERRELVKLSQEIIVYPCLDPAPGFETLLAAVAGEIEMRQRGQSQDFHGIRPYQALESWRRMDWKATAHTGSPQVREYSREEDEGVVIYLDVDASAEQSAWFEQVVHCCAYLAYQLAGLGRRIRFRSQDCDVSVPSQGDVYTILRYLALVAPRPGARPGTPDATDQYQVVFSADPARMAALGWGNQAGGGRKIAGFGCFREERKASQRSIRKNLAIRNGAGVQANEDQALES